MTLMNNHLHSTVAVGISIIDAFSETHLTITYVVQCFLKIFLFLKKIVVLVTLMHKCVFALEKGEVRLCVRERKGGKAVKMINQGNKTPSSPLPPPFLLSLPHQEFTFSFKKMEKFWPLNFSRRHF